MQWTQEKARQMSALGVQARRNRAINPPLTRADLNEAIRSLSVNPSINTDALNARARALDKHLERLKAMLEKSDNPQDILRLCQAIDRLENSYARYAGIPGPGNLKPSRQRTRPQLAEPIEPE